MKQHDTKLAAQLFDNPEVFNFFQAVRLLDAINYEKTRFHPEWKQYPVGYDYSQQKETVRFKVDPALKFPDGQITKLTAAELDSTKNRLTPAIMQVTFMGLTGPSGVLPMHYSELILEQNRKKDYALSDFFDLFNHRAVSLYYRGWEKYQVQYHFERLRREGNKNDNLTKILKSLAGFGLNKQQKTKISQDSLLFYSGLFTQQRKSTIGLETILSDYFDVPVKIQQFIGSWHRLHDSECTRTPSKTMISGQFNRLGKDTIIGKRVWYSQGKFRLQLGPLNQAQFQQFLPGSANLQKLKELTRAYIGSEFNFDIQLISERHSVPQCQLKKVQPPRLGYFTWLRGKSQEIQHDKLVLV